MPKNVKSRNVDRKRPKRVYRCDGCDAAFNLHPGAHWHTCNNTEWRMVDAIMAAGVEQCVSEAFSALLRKRANDV